MHLLVEPLEARQIDGVNHDGLLPHITVSWKSFDVLSMQVASLLKRNWFHRGGRLRRVQNYTGLSDEAPYGRRGSTCVCVHGSHTQVYRQVAKG